MFHKIIVTYNGNETITENRNKEWKLIYQKEKKGRLVF
ncbi:MAG: Unknown protein [uncultured Sulfurovum sp.]|uniref:Uncharacterized protein n=1 Tax=uncultured Sulfurovum sp. TaxID=269237 RepID=A0A6S6TIH1_9BACT|nr:MAG: Unknown protein [uncultured Sulfurovum sp.]